MILCPSPFTKDFCEKSPQKYWSFCAPRTTRTRSKLRNEDHGGAHSFVTTISAAQEPTLSILQKRTQQQDHDVFEDIIDNFRKLVQQNEFPMINSRLRIFSAKSTAARPGGPWLADHHAAPTSSCHDQLKPLQCRRKRWERVCMALSFYRG